MQPLLRQALRPARLAAVTAAVLSLGCGGSETPPTQDAAPRDARSFDAPAEVAPSEGGPGDGGPGQSPFRVYHRASGGQTLNAITGWDADHFIAVGSSEVSYVYTQGKLERLGGDVPGSDFEAVWGSSPTDVYAAGAVTAGGGFVAHYDGHAWTTVYKTPVRLYGIWGTMAAAEGVLAVGEQGSVYGYITGMGWAPEGTLPINPDAPDAAMTKSSPILTAVSGRNVNDFTITSNGAEFFHFEPDAGGLAYYRPELDPNTNFSAAWQDPNASGTSVYIGSNFYGLYYFSAQDTPVDASVLSDGSAGRMFAPISTDPKAKGAEGLSVHGIWGASKKVVAVGDAAHIMVLDLASGHTGVVAAPSDATGTFGGVWGSSLADIWIVGPDETLLHGSLP